MKKIISILSLCIMLSGCSCVSVQKTSAVEPVLPRWDVQQIIEDSDDCELDDTGYKGPAVVHEVKAFGMACTLFSAHFCCYAAYENYAPICMSYNEVENAWTVYFADTYPVFFINKALWVTIDKKSGKVISMPEKPSDTVFQSKEKQAQQRLGWSFDQVIQYKNIPVPENGFEGPKLSDAQVALDVACDLLLSGYEDSFRKKGYWKQEPFDMVYNEVQEFWIIRFQKGLSPDAEYRWAGGETDIALDANTAEVLAYWGGE